VSHHQVHDKVWHGVGITEDPNVLDGDIRHRDEQFIQIFKAVSEVFPSDPFPFEGVEQYRMVRRALDQIDTQLRLRTGPFRDTELRAERGRLYRDALQVFDADLRLSRKQKLARMALSRDWSEMPSYIREGIVMWKCRMLLRSGALFSRVGFPRAHDIYEARVEGQADAPLAAPSLISMPRPVSHSRLRPSLARLGVAIVKAGPIAAIRTGSLALDEALEIGGFPRGRIVEIFGKEGVGKTTLALKTAANAQRVGAVALVDAEHKLDLPWARVNGLNVDEALILQGTRAKDTMDSILQLIRSGDFALVVVDSLTALFPGEDLEASDGDFTSEMGRLFARTLPRIASAAGRTQTCVLLLNQVRHNEEIFGRKTISAGGHALAHHSSIRLELARMMAQKDGDNVVGYGVKGTVVKSCVGPPFRVAVWNINFERGIDLESELIEEGVNRGVISKETTALKFRGERLGANNNAAREFLLQHPDLAAVLETQLRATMKRMAGGGGYYDSR
jgi:recombination protein RecA